MADSRLEKFLLKRYKTIAGIDEAGRGPWAGPVVSACVVIDRDFRFKKEHRLIDDSKKLTDRKRRELADMIRRDFGRVGIGVVDNGLIDRMNILKATFLSMENAYRDCRLSCDLILIDGNKMIPGIKDEQQAIIDGDAKHVIIAAAGIIAKVARDDMMSSAEERYPGYGFSQNKGYGTAAHREALARLGPCPIHRFSYRPVADIVKICGIKYNSSKKGEEL